MICFSRSLTAFVWTAVGCLALMVVAVAPAPAQSGNSAAPPVTWYRNLQYGMSRMLAEQRPGIVVFYTKGAAPVQRMHHTTLTEPSVMSLLGGMVCVAVDVADSPELRKQYDIHRVPTVLMLDARGREIDRTVKYKTPRVFLQYLERFQHALEKSHGSAIGAFTTSAVDVTQPTPYTKPTVVTFDSPHGSERQVWIIGDFNDWRNAATPMSYYNGEWQVTLHLEVGQTYEYLFIISEEDGWIKDPKNPLSRPNPYGSENSVLAPGAVRQSPVVNGNSVLFTLYAPDVQEVRVAGNFTNWQKVPMYRHSNNPNFWGLKYDLPAGEYFYKLVVDGEWMYDPENYTPAMEGENMNSSFVVR